MGTIGTDVNSNWKHGNQFEHVCKLRYDCIHCALAIGMTFPIENVSYFLASGLLIWNGSRIHTNGTLSRKMISYALRSLSNRFIIAFTFLLSLTAAIAVISERGERERKSFVFLIKSEWIAKSHCWFASLALSLFFLLSFSSN